jgi:hypothetical protein
VKKELDNYDPYVVLEKRRKAWQKYSKTEKGKRAVRKGQLKSKYNLDLDGYEKKLKEQGHKCAICGVDEIDLDTKLAVDHDHKTNKVRDLLCRSCNVGLGNFKDSIRLLTYAIAYLDKHK